MNTIFVHRDGRTEQASSIDRSWLGPASGVYVWVDLAAPSIPESLVLSDTFAFHPLAVNDALSRRAAPKIEPYAGYLFASFVGGDTDTAFFVGGHYLVSVRRGESKAVADLMDSLRHGGKAFADGPVALWHRLVDASVTGLGPVMEKTAASVDSLEKRLVTKASPDLMGEILKARGELFELSQRLSRERDALARLVGREIVEISDEMVFRFRDVRDSVSRLLDDGLVLNFRLSGLMTAAAGLGGGRRWM